MDPKDELLTEICCAKQYLVGFPSGSEVKKSACIAGDVDSIPGSGRSLGGGHSNPLQHFCLENPRDRKTCWATVHGVAKSWTRLGTWCL